jgi:hypothetical protein
MVTCGQYGLCKPPDPVLDDAEPEELPPCPNNAPRCERDGRSYCPAVPGFRFRAASDNGMRVRFERQAAGVAAHTEVTWHLGPNDESETAGPVVYHLYRVAGKYPVTLEVTESVCQTRQSRTVTIEVPPVLEVPARLPSPMPSPSPSPSPS